MSTIATPWQSMLTANGTDTAWATMIPTTTKPSGSGVLDRSGDALPLVPDQIAAIFWGRGADNATGSVRLVGWRPLGSLWIPCIIFEADLTLSTAVGVAGQTATDSDRFADTIALASAYSDLSGVSVRPTSPADNSPAHLIVDVTGFPLRRWMFKRGTATQLGGAWADL